MPEELTLLAHAKLNLTLAVTGRRADGLHTLDTVMQSVSLANRIRVCPDDRVTLACDDPALPTDARNTAVRAANAFFAKTGIRGGARIAIEKRIPYEAGLGSASADAAAVLTALDRLYGARLDERELCGIALTVGADVPFCLIGGTRRAIGVGETFLPTPQLSRGAFLIVKPARGVPTKEAYRALDALPDPVRPEAQAMADAIAAGDLAAVGRLCENAFTACCGDAESKRILRGLRERGALGASMSGSGSALFGLFWDEAAAAAALPALRAEDRFCAVALPVDRGVAICE